MLSPQVRDAQGAPDAQSQAIAVLVELLNQLRQAASLVDVNVAAGIAHETLQSLIGCCIGFIG